MTCGYAQVITCLGWESLSLAPNRNIRGLFMPMDGRYPGNAGAISRVCTGCTV